MWSSIKFRRIKDTYALTLQLLGQDIKKCGLRPISPHIRYLRPHSSISWTRYQEMWSTANFPAYKILTPSLFNFLDKISRNIVYCQFPRIQDTYTLTLQLLGQDIKKCGQLPISPHTKYLHPHSSISWTGYQGMWPTENFPTYKKLTPSLFNFLDKISRNVVYSQFPHIQDTYALTLQFLGQDIKKCGLLPISSHTSYLRPHSSISWTRYQEM